MIYEWKFQDIQLYYFALLLSIDIQFTFRSKKLFNHLIIYITANGISLKIAGEIG